MTLREGLARGEAQLRQGPHPERARRDAETLLQHLVGKNRAWLLSHLDDGLGESEAIVFAGLLERRLRGEPIQYIMGETEFYGLPFRVTPDVLIPRPETEHLVEKAVELGWQFSKPRIVDVGTGSGAIAIALAHAVANALVTAVDLSDKSLAIARANAERNAVADRVQFLRGDLLAPVASERFEIVVSNPPYVAAADREALAVEVREHEPEIALFAGEDGLAMYRRLIPQAYAVIVPGGFIALELGFGQAEAVGLLLEEAGFAEIAFTRDLQGIPRVAAARRV
ncbi:MAG: peptide chain release factor N(5)-glutamine methyltransferase [Terracidiphilus sp.]